MPSEHILFESDGAVATITINREAVLMRGQNAATRNELFAALHEVEADDELRDAMITGAGDEAFVAGADIDELRALPSATLGRQDSQRAHEVGLYMAEMSKIVIAAINGFALGGGCRAGHELRYPPGRRQRQARPARDQPGDHARLGRHPAPDSAGWPRHVPSC